MVFVRNYLGGVENITDRGENYPTISNLSIGFPENNPIFIRNNTVFNENNTDIFDFKGSAQ